MYLIKSAKSPFWQILFKNAKGKFTTKSTGKKLKSEALIFLTDFKSSLENPIEAALYSKSLKEFETEYFNVVSSIRSKSYKNEIIYAFKILIDISGNIPLCQFNQAMAEKFINDIYERSKYSAALHYRTLKAAFEKAKQWDYISENPFRKFKLPRLPKHIPVFIEYRHLKRIIKVTRTKLLRDIYLTGYFSGLRLGELLNLRWDAVDFKNRFIKVENTNTFTTKNKKERIIPINESLYEILSSRYPKSKITNAGDYIFTRVKGVLLNTDYISKSFKKAVRRAKLDDRIHFHTLRHSFASCLVQNGVSLYVVKELLGHQDITTTQIYAHIKSDNLIDAVKKLEPRVRKSNINKLRLLKTYPQKSNIVK